MALTLKHAEGYLHTYRDYIRMPDDGNRWEIINGVLHMMAAPGEKHQRAVSNIHGELHAFLKGKRCRVYTAPFDVRLPVYGEIGENVTNVVQPDVLVYCDDSKTDERGGRAAPDLVVEVISPSSAKMDRILKYRLYERAGVKEYWLVDSVGEFAEVYVNDGNRFLPKYKCVPGDVISSNVIEGFELPIADIFL